MANVGIKETMEVLEAAKQLPAKVVRVREAAAKIMEDGKISLKDLPELYSAIKDISDYGPVAAAAIADSQKIPAELLDLEALEVTALYEKGAEVVEAWQDAF